MGAIPTFRVPTIFARAWNSVRDMARRNRPFQGVGIYLTWTKDGVIVSLKPGALFKHPWQLSCSWRADSKVQPAGGQWVATVNPGFLNCGDVSISESRVVKGVLTDGDYTLIDETPPSLIFDSLRNPAGSSGLVVTDAGELQQGAGEGYPAFFTSLGVVPVAKAGDPNQDNSDPNRTRQIRACDIILVTQRPSAAQQVTVQSATLDAQDVSVSTTITAALPDPPRLSVVPQWSPPIQPTAADVLNGDAVEPTTDQIKIATLYLVSPADADPEAPPDETWTPYPLYFVFWNLAHCSQAPVLVAPPDPLKLSVPLAAGVGQSLVNAMLANVNDQESLTAAYLNTVSFQGLYWAPSGVGWDITKRPVRATAATPIGGFTPGAVKSATAVQAPPAQVLNPPFPFLLTKFDPVFFNLDQELTAPSQP
ncbi:MAG: hypothetical protein P4L99_28140 [Chthoniobacter sp.]|nr:hypothetical protein [Chthoniobacter sp.]